jgi:hypothetical protein
MESLLTEEDKLGHQSRFQTLPDVEEGWIRFDGRRLQTKNEFIQYIRLTQTRKVFSVLSTDINSTKSLMVVFSAYLDQSGFRGINTQN